ncbi:MAG: putative sugar nucleotidyl transferase [Rubricoccaceae bacterium]|nr:putative sugar nucleotidyl transferase [Rubricoccaceae bacterium]
MPLCVFEDDAVRHLAPLTLTRAAFDLRVGAVTLLGRLRDAFETSAGPLVLHTRPRLAAVTAQEHPDALVNTLPESGGVLFVNGRWLAREGDLLDAVRDAIGSDAPRAWALGDDLVAAWHPAPPPDALDRPLRALVDGAEAAGEAVLVRHLWDLLDDLGGRIAHDVERLGGLGQHEGYVHPGAVLHHPERLHVGIGAAVRPGAILNAESGPIHLGPEAVVEEGAVVRGPVYLGPRAVVKAAGRVETSAVGTWSKVGGEVHESVVHSFSNKAHDGYLGNSYLGRWCNLGADTNTSNLKNDYGEVTVYDAVAGDFVGSGSQFVGLFMGDHSKCSINTMFNTGTVVGVFCNLFGSGFPPRHVPSFAWGGAEGLVPYRVEKALRVAEAVMARRDVPLTDDDRALLTAIAEEDGLAGES